MVHLEAHRKTGSERIAHQEFIDDIMERDRQARERNRKNNRHTKPSGIGCTALDGAGGDMKQGQDVSLLTAVDLPDRNEKGKTDFIRNFILSPEFQVLQGEFKGYLGKTFGEEEINKICAKFAGASFEQLGYQYFAEDSKGDGVDVLSPEGTDKYFLSNFPGNKVIQFPFNKIGLAGLVVPDCLVIEGGKIMSQVEFTLCRQEDYFHHKYGGFRRNKSNPALGFLHENAQLVFGVVNDFPSDLEAEVQGCYGSEVEFYHVPFTLTAFKREVLHPFSYLWQGSKE